MLHAICIRNDSISTLQVVALTKHIMLIPLFAKTIQTRPFEKTLEEIYSARISRRFPMLLLPVLKSQVLNGVRLKNSPVQTSNETCRFNTSERNLLLSLFRTTFRGICEIRSLNQVL